MTRIVQGMAMRIALVMMVAMTVAHAQPTDWRRAEPGRVLSVPADHVSHPDYRLEWWYYTGNVTGAEGRAYGYQVTFFRYGLVREPASRSPWAVRDLFMAHVAVTDRATGVHLYEDRINRAGLHWAGARTDRYDVWNETWRVSLDADGRHHLAIDAETFALDLRLEPGKPAVLQGDRGYSRKGSDPGNASHYYSLTRMPTSGTLRIGSKDVRVTGASWMDHEFGSSTLERHVQGWDWFALQLDDGRDLMFYRLRRKDGSVDPHSKGVLVAADGRTRLLSWNEVTLQPLGEWVSPKTGDRYPARWRLRLPAEKLDLTITPKVADQEMRLTVRYWEGAVAVGGRFEDRAISGQGYLEMTRYETSISP